MVASIPECPDCGAPMRLASDLTGAGLSRSWLCTDSTCPCVVPEEEARRLAVRDDVLGGPIESLMRASVTPQGGGGGNGKSRRAPKPGEGEAMRAKRERRYLDQEPAGGRDRDARVEPLVRNVQGWVGADMAVFLEVTCSQFGVTQSVLVRTGLELLCTELRNGGGLCERCGSLVKFEQPGCVCIVDSPAI